MLCNYITVCNSLISRDVISECIHRMQTHDFNQIEWMLAFYKTAYSHVLVLWNNDHHLDPMT